jgi:C4-dicarboxylate-specific signal transduction histidine kinase
MSVPFSHCSRKATVRHERVRGRSWLTFAMICAVAVLVTGFRHVPEESTDWGSFPSFSQTEFRDAILLPILTLQSIFIVSLLVQGRRRRRSEKLLRESREIMDFAANAAHLQFWSWDIERNRVWVTDHKNHPVTKPPRWDLDPLSCLDFVHPEDRAQFHACAKECIANAGSFELEHRTMTRGGRVRWAKVRARAEADASGRVVRLSGIVLDITELKASEAEAAKQREMLTHSGRIGVLGELSGAIAHELSQPLAAILSNAQAAQRLLTGNGPDLNELRSIVTDIIGDDKRARDVIVHLHSLLKKGTGAFEAVDLNSEVKLALALAHSDLVRRRVEVATVLDPEVGRVMGDRVQISQILLNLILNAADAMQTKTDGNRCLTIVTSRNAAGHSQVAVRDNGPGIADGALTQVFEPFYSTKSHGLGLGLSICRTIVAAHNGQLWARNNADVGATFLVSFPVLAQEAA